MTLITVLFGENVYRIHLMTKRNLIGRYSTVK